MPDLLIADDDFDLAEAMRLLFAAEGHTVRVVNEPGEVLPALEERCPDLVVLDIMFGENITAGFDLCRAIAKRFPGLRVIMHSAVNEELGMAFSETSANTPVMPAEAFIEKTGDLEQLKKVVNEVLSR
jgi:DNA-binding NtrC family response regulator